MATLGPVPLREWATFMIQVETNRLRDSGGHRRKSKESRPLAPKTVRHILAVLKLGLSKVLALPLGIRRYYCRFRVVIHSATLPPGSGRRR